METASYKRRYVILFIVLIAALIAADHITSPTFAYNMGRGGDSILLKQDQMSGSGCGEP